MGSVLSSTNLKRSSWVISSRESSSSEELKMKSHGNDTRSTTEIAKRGITVSCLSLYLTRTILTAKFAMKTTKISKLTSSQQIIWSEHRFRTKHSKRSTCCLKRCSKRNGGTELLRLLRKLLMISRLSFCKLSSLKLNFQGQVRRRDKARHLPTHPKCYHRLSRCKSWAFLSCRSHLSKVKIKSKSKILKLSYSKKTWPCFNLMRSQSTVNRAMTSKVLILTVSVRHCTKQRCLS